MAETLLGDKSGSEEGQKKENGRDVTRTRTGTDATVLPCTLSHIDLNEGYPRCHVLPACHHHICHSSPTAATRPAPAHCIPY